MKKPRPDKKLLSLFQYKNGQRVKMAKHKPSGATEKSMEKMTVEMLQKKFIEKFKNDDHNVKKAAALIAEILKAKD